jgi:Arc/MetJ-type ribon-helix-helix transcriptional regulator
MLNDMQTEQIAVRLPVELLAALDDMVQQGRFESRAAGVRAGLIVLSEADLRQKVDQSIIDGYTRIPPTKADDAAALASLREAITEEPW